MEAGKFGDDGLTTSGCGSGANTGVYCPLGSQYELFCPMGYYQPNQNRGSCFECPAGSYCMDGTSKECEKGYYCD